MVSLPCGSSHDRVEVEGAFRRFKLQQAAVHRFYKYGPSSALFTKWFALKPPMAAGRASLELFRFLHGGQ